MCFLPQNKKNNFDSDIFIENIAIFPTLFLNINWSWIMLRVEMNVLCFVSLLPMMLCLHYRGLGRANVCQ